MSIRFTGSFVLLLCLGSCTNPEAQLRLGYINSGQVMQQYHGTAAKRHQIELQARIWQTSLDSISAKLGPGLSAANQEARLAPHRLRYQQSLQKVSQAADQELLSDVNAYIKKFGESSKYALIFGATESGNIVYAAPTNDLTKEVIEGLNQQYDKLHPDSGSR